MRSAFIIAALALVASATVLPRVPNGNQFITGPCTKDFDCVSDCCAFTTGKCAGAVIAQTRDGGCGFGEAAPNNRAAIAIQGPNATRAPGVPAPGAAAPAAAPAAGGGGGGSVTVKSGDTCSAIAAARGTTTGAIIAANPSVNAGCTNLQVGQTLNVGGGGGGAPAPAPAAGGGGKGVGSSGKGPGGQFITGDCANDGECASGCCALDTGKCAARLVAQERKGCGRST